MLYIGAILLSVNVEESDALKERGGSIYSPAEDREVPVADPYVQVWGHKVVDATSGVYYYNCPLEFLEKTEPTSEPERRWREEVRQRAAARGA